MYLILLFIPIGSTCGYGDDPDRLFLKFKTHEVKYNFVSRKKKSPLLPSINRFFQSTPVFLFFVLFDKKKKTEFYDSLKNRHAYFVWGWPIIVVRFLILILTQLTIISTVNRMKQLPGTLVILKEHTLTCTLSI